MSKLPIPIPIPTIEDKDKLIHRIAKMVDISYQEGEYYQALDTLDLALKCDPTNNILWYYRAKICSQLDMLHASLHALNKSLEYNPEYDVAIEDKKIVEKKIASRYSMRSYR